MTLGFYFSHKYLEGDKHNRGRSIIIHQKIYSCKVWKLHQCPVYCRNAQLGRNSIGRRLFSTAGHDLKFKVFGLFFKSVTHGFLSYISLQVNAKMNKKNKENVHASYEVLVNFNSDLDNTYR